MNIYEFSSWQNKSLAVSAKQPKGDDWLFYAQPRNLKALEKCDEVENSAKNECNSSTVTQYLYSGPEVLES